MNSQTAIARALSNRSAARREFQEAADKHMLSCTPPLRLPPMPRPPVDGEAEILDSNDSIALVRTYNQRWLLFFSPPDDGGWSAIQIRSAAYTLHAALDQINPYAPSERGRTVRQGDLYFLPTAFNPSKSSENYSSSGSRHIYKIIASTMNSEIGGTRHIAEQIVWGQKSGECAFLGRRNIRLHDYVGHIRCYVFGKISHPHHPAITLSEWHEVRAQLPGTLNAPVD